MLNKFFTVAALAMAATGVFADGTEILPTSFELEWGESLESFQERFQVDEIIDRDLFSFLLVSQGASLPSNTDKLIVSAHPEFGIVKFHWISENFTSDIFGSKGKKEFDSLYKILNEKYGFSGEKTTVVGLELWDESDEFYQCLKYDGCGAWMSFWGHTDNNEIHEDSTAFLELKGLERGAGYLSLSVEHPEFSSVLNNASKANKNKF